MVLQRNRMVVAAWIAHGLRTKSDKEDMIGDTEGWMNHLVDTPSLAWAE
jgi:hypothetical protein